VEALGDLAVFRVEAQAMSASVIIGLQRIDGSSTSTGMSSSAMSPAPTARRRPGLLQPQSCLNSMSK
jgi:hypothetical protein